MENKNAKNWNLAIWKRVVISSCDGEMKGYTNKQRNREANQQFRLAEWKGAKKISFFHSIHCSSADEKEMFISILFVKSYKKA